MMRDREFRVAIGGLFFSCGIGGLVQLRIYSIAAGLSAMLLVLLVYEVLGLIVDVTEVSEDDEV